ncbi:MAG: helix-turn-helix transcriptional regulator [Clostridiales bacterium]|nr:helix-turn-helix transcriptional regulator [Clostridiales bacterium]
MSTKNMEIMDIVRKVRIESGMSRDKLAHESNVSEKTIKNMEKGKNIKWSTVMAVASVLNMNLGDLNPCIGKEAPMRKDEKKEN